MASNDYRFVTRWTVRGKRADVYRILSDPTGYVRWWPDVYLEVRPEHGAGPDGLGASGFLLTKGWLPYRLRWRYETVAADPPAGFSIKASGDFEGGGVWEFTQRGDEVDILFTWTIRAEKPLLRYLSFVFKPFFSANHRWAMERGLVRLREELARIAGR
jgi:uncharacterized protein YndB with AHSA1/START domain